MEKEMGELSFVAEDLGDIDEHVLNLRDEFNLPGMKVLQFAFGEDMGLHIASGRLGECCHQSQQGHRPGQPVASQ